MTKEQILSIIDKKYKIKLHHTGDKGKRLGRQNYDGNENYRWANQSERKYRFQKNAEKSRLYFVS